MSTRNPSLQWFFGRSQCSILAVFWKDLSNLHRGTTITVDFILSDLLTDRHFRFFFASNQRVTNVKPRSRRDARDVLPKVCFKTSNREVGSILVNSDSPDVLAWVAQASVKFLLRRWPKPPGLLDGLTGKIEDSVGDDARQVETDGFQGCFRVCVASNSAHLLFWQYIDSYLLAL